RHTRFSRDWSSDVCSSDLVGRVHDLHGTQEDYLRELGTRFEGLDLAGLRVLLDCAHGATFAVAPEIFRRLGADVTTVAAEPDGQIGRASRRARVASPPSAA